MSGLECMRVGRLLDAMASGIGDTDRLRVEEHLGECAECRGDAGLLAGLRAVAAGLEPLDVAARERALSRALSEAGRARPATAAHRRRGLVLGGVGLAAAAAVALAFGRPQLAPPGAPVASSAAQVAHDHFVSGELTVAGHALASGAEIASGELLYTELGAELALGHGRLQLSPDSAVRWHDDRATVELEHGHLVAQVDPAPHRRFVVQTHRFAVVVLGTRFEVSPDEVTVHEGRVRIVSPEGRLLVDALGAGGHWRVHGAEASPPPPSTASANHGPAPHPARPEHARAKAAADAGAQLAGIRATLASGDTGSARSQLAGLMQGRLSAAQRAEALSLRAECAQVEGDLDSAVGDYLRVARRYARRPAGDNALFAAARLELGRGHRDVARKLFERYVARYPEGRFAREARARLLELAP